MNIQTPERQPRPLPDTAHADQTAAGHPDTEGRGAPDRAPEAELSPIGLLCDGILAAINAAPGFPRSAKMTIGTQVGNILAEFQEQEQREADARQKIIALKSSMRAVKEQLAKLRHEHFGASSEKGRAGIEEEDPAPLFDDEEEWPKEKPKGKRPAGCRRISRSSRSSTTPTT